MGIQINGNNDIISALDGSWTAEGASINTSGILTATTFKGNIVGTAATFTGPVTIGGTLTYEDVTNIDSVGIVTARSGLKVTGGQLDVGSNIKLGNAGVVTATSFVGGLTGTSGSFSASLDIADKIRHTGDTNTAIRFPGNDTFQVETDGSARLKITDSDLTMLDYASGDKVGIGTNVLVAKLDVRNNSNIPVLKLMDSHYNKYLTIRGGGSPNRMVIDAYEGSGGGADIDLASNGSTKVRITSAGKVGINSTSPTYGMHLHGTSASNNAYYYAEQSSAGASAGFRLKTTGSHFAMYGAVSGSALGIYDYNAGAERFTIDSAGRVGVGTFAPHSSYRFDIRDNSNVYLHLGQGGATLAAMANNSWNALSFQGTNAELGLFKDSSGNFSYIMGTYQGGTAIPVIFRTGNRAERLRITFDGKVLVGDGSVITPSRHLDVRGTGSQGILVGSTNNNGAQLLLDGIGGGDGSGGNYGALEVPTSGHFTIRNHDADKDIILGTGAANGSNDTVVITDTQKVGIGCDPDYVLDIRAASGDVWVSARGGTNQGYMVRKSDNTLIGYAGNGAGVNLGTNDFAIAAPNANLSLCAGGTAASHQRLRLLSSGRILGGNHLNDRGAVFQIESSDHAQIGIHRNTADHGAPAMNFSASRGTSAGANNLVLDNDYLGMIRFAGADGSDLASGAYITGIVDGTAASNKMPTRLGFWTSDANSQSPTERLRIDSDGRLIVGASTNTIVNAFKVAIKETSGENAAIVFLDTDNMKGGICGISKGNDQLITGTNNVDFIVGSSYNKTHIITGNGSNATGYIRATFDTSGHLWNNNVKTFRWGGYIQCSTAVSVNLPYATQGNVYHIKCMFSHYNQSYGAYRVSDLWVYSGHSGIQQETVRENFDSSSGGAWTITRGGSSSDPIVVAKSAGTYSGFGHWWIEATAGWQ